MFIISKYKKSKIKVKIICSALIDLPYSGHTQICQEALMFQFLYIFGPAAVTFLVVRKITGDSSENAITSVIRFIAYAAIDAALTTLLLLPFGRVEFVIYDSGIRDLRYGFTAFLLSLILAVIAGIGVAAIDKRTELHIEITKEERHGKNTGKYKESRKEE